MRSIQQNSPGAKSFRVGIKTVYRSACTPSRSLPAPAPGLPPNPRPTAIGQTYGRFLPCTLGRYPSRLYIRAPVAAPIKKVWIEEGCISCKVCEDIAPQVFVVDGDDTCIVKPDAGLHFGTLQDDIEEAAEDCPVEVIQIAHGDEGGPA